MKILVTGAKGFVGRNLVENLLNIQSGKNRTRDLSIDAIYQVDRDTEPEMLKAYASKADFVFNLAGVNRPKNVSEFTDGNVTFVSELLDALKDANNPCPIMLSSSMQASLSGRFADSEYGRSKLAGEELYFDYAKQTGAEILVYRFPNLFGKWARPNYNSAVATFCNNIAHDLPIQVNDPSIALDLVYIDDLVEEMFDALEGHAHHCNFNGTQAVADEHGRYCYVPTFHTETLGRIVDLLHQFAEQPQTLELPSIPGNSFANKLYATYLSYLPQEKAIFAPKMHPDDRGSFTELIRTSDHGQVSVNISKPGITKGEHWHNTKWEQFIVVSGHGLIQERRIGTDEVLNFEVSGETLQVVQMLPGYVHNIINLSDTEDMVTVMWANEAFNPNCPDTYAEKVVKSKENSHG